MAKRLTTTSQPNTERAREKYYRQQLETYGFTRSGSTKYRWPMYAGFAGVALLAALLVALTTDLGTVAMLGVAATVGGAASAFWQSSNSRQEASLDRFYDRLELGNKYRMDVVKTAHTPDAASVAYVYFVYTELDNLEYAIQKYRSGALSARHAFRALRTFIERCENSSVIITEGSSRLYFYALARAVLDRATKDAETGYTRLTIDVLRKIFDLDGCKFTPAAVDDRRRQAVGDAAGLAARVTLRR